MAPNELHYFRIATVDDRQALRTFLADQWNPELIYLKSDLLLDYDFRFENNLNFLLALNQDDQIDGILGFILYGQEYKNSDVFTVLWKVRPKSGDPMLGMTLLDKLISEFGFRIVSTVGANAKTLPIYEFMGYKTGQLQHYFILNDQLSEFNICTNTPKIGDDNKPIPQAGKQLVSFESYDKLTVCFNPEKYKERIPYKSPQYINKRYFNHPFYIYKVLGIADVNGVVNSILVAREVAQNGSTVLRVVDFIGDKADLTGIGTSLKALLYGNGYEYIDFLQYGIDHDIMLEAGFQLRDNYEDLIIPNYFEPFKQTNIKINFFTTASEPFYIFKADGDQDRPSRINA
ncbi:hypothetical protein [Chitinophaga sp. CF418]|uniref:hypothetical protein n=1 Tax=Chitinophaga sp. CF418 TaxID=1855287 RepID=UPI0009107E5D|nr:hypothetical protein [Chitinophaga sp. CF418]SHM13904.1 hypothetical protein SAMN05216311_101694 [Chitinophaga sp. CF418]